jgi:RNA polymerase sigma factor (sigma-70 family)
MRQLVQRHASRLHACAYRMLGDASLAEEVVQDVFAAMARGGAAFRRDAALGTWLHAIAVNRCRTIRKRRSFVTERNAEPLDVHHADPAAGAHDHLEAEERNARLTRAVAALPADMREVIVLRFAGGRSYDEIAQIHGCAPGTVASRLHRALRRLADELGVSGLTRESI